MATVPAVWTLARQAYLAWPMGIPDASDLAIAPMQVTAAPRTLNSDLVATVQLTASVAAVTASWYGVANTSARTGVSSVAGSAGTVMGTASK